MPKNLIYDLNNIIDKKQFKINPKIVSQQINSMNN